MAENGKNAPPPLICQVVECFRQGVWTPREMPAMRRLVLLIKASYGDVDGGNVYPSQYAVARDSALARSAVYAHTRALRELGVLELVCARGSGYRTDLEQVVLPAGDWPSSRTSGRRSTGPAGGPQLALSESRLALLKDATGPAGGPNHSRPSEDHSRPDPPLTRFAREVPPASGGDGLPEQSGARAPDGKAAEGWARVRAALPDRELVLQHVEPVAFADHLLTIRVAPHVGTSVRERHMPAIVAAAREAFGDDRLTIELAGETEVPEPASVEQASPRRRRRRRRAA